MEMFNLQKLNNMAVKKQQKVELKVKIVVPVLN